MIWFPFKKHNLKTKIQIEDLTLKNDDATLKNDDVTLKIDDASLKNDDASLKNDDATLKIDDITLKNDDASLKIDRLTAFPSITNWYYMHNKIKLKLWNLASKSLITYYSAIK